MGEIQHTSKHALVLFTCVIEQACDEGAVPEEGVRGGDVLEVALFKHRVFKHHGLHLQVEEPDKEAAFLYQMLF